MASTTLLAIRSSTLRIGLCGWAAYSDILVHRSVAHYSLSSAGAAEKLAIRSVTYLNEQ